ncbi:hypothetical protein BCR39DRAFT_506867 [Naematelia encephala]|uniref:Uncharacterized protein n=1 Tax=Naematelia encephala TaxID=71784 RepID=A0A1Y2ATP8_9TREE|nr:hypothetical protein BCR39DRAFT_506867 [Naematelia encephala]
MDYLTILATRSLVLFPRPKQQLHPRSSSTTSSLSSPKTPTMGVPSPSPIVMPIHSIVYDDSHTAHFLVQHLLRDSGLGLGFGMSPGREMTHEAEVLVWREIDKAKMFVRALGEWFATSTDNDNSGRIDQGSLDALAAKFGLGIKGDGDTDSEGVGEDEEQINGGIAIPHKRAAVHT